MTHPLYPTRCDIDDPDYEKNCPFFEKLKTPTPIYEDPLNISQEELENRLVWYWFNEEAKLITLKEAGIEFVNGKPVTPVKTGLKGRGILSKFGPQHAADPVVTCWFDNKLYFVAVLREDTNEWAIPGGFVDPGENYSETLRREFKEETCDGEDEALLDYVFSNGEVIYAGSTFDDPRTTDNAWIETIVVHFHIEEEFANKINLVSQPGETKKVEWIECDRELYGGHGKFLEIIREKMYYEKLISYSNNSIDYKRFIDIGVIFMYICLVITMIYSSLKLKDLMQEEESINKQLEINRIEELDCFMSYVNNPIIISKYCEK